MAKGKRRRPKQASAERSFLTSASLAAAAAVLAFLFSFWWNAWNSPIESQPAWKKISNTKRKPRHALEDRIALKHDDRETCRGGCAWQFPCEHPEQDPFIAGCHPLAGPALCRRLAIPDFANAEVIDALRNIATKGMHGRSDSGGPTILDINSGFLRDGDGIVNLYSGDRATDLFSRDEFTLYRDVTDAIRSTVMQAFELETLHLTAPTFITRLVGNSSWEPASMHDEYYHVHVDKLNTPHYDYSGLLYLSDYSVDFEGGLFTFQAAPSDDDEVHMAIEPSRGLLLAFNAGPENPHQVQKVTSGRRYVLSFWFTCDERRSFRSFLDGRAHDRFEGGGGEGAGDGVGEDAKAAE